MRFGLYVSTFGERDARTLAELASAAEVAGWDGFFVPDHLLWTPDAEGVIADTTVALAAIALATRRLRFGALVTALARRRPWKLAKELATLDRLSGGRAILGAGLGGAVDFEPVGEAPAGRERAAVLDEALEVVESLWSGEPVEHRGRHFSLAGARLRPTPVQRPRIPVWIGGFWPNRAPFRRAARWDGALPLKRGHLLEPLSPAELAECGAYVASYRDGDDPFDLAAFVVGQPPTAELAAAYRSAGASWWIDASHLFEGSLDSLRERIAAGPPG